MRYADLFTLPPAPDSAFMVNLIAATGVANAAWVGVDEPLCFQGDEPEDESVM